MRTFAVVGGEEMFERQMKQLKKKLETKEV